MKLPNRRQDHGTTPDAPPSPDDVKALVDVLRDADRAIEHGATWTDLALAVLGSGYRKVKQ